MNQAIWLYIFGAIVFLVAVPFLLWVLLVGPLVSATRECVRRNTTHGFFVNASASRPLILTLAIQPFILLVYVIDCAIISIRLLLGVPPGVTSRHAKSLMLAAALAAVATACASAFLIVPLLSMNQWWDRGSFEAKGLGRLYWCLATWWVPALLGLALGAVIGLSRVDGDLEPPAIGDEENGDELA
jgi:hypothetical protein